MDAAYKKLYHVFVNNLLRTYVRGVPVSMCKTCFDLNVNNVIEEYMYGYDTKAQFWTEHRIFTSLKILR